MKKKSFGSSIPDEGTSLTRRTFVLGGIKLCLTSFLVGRLAYLSGIRSSHYQTLSDGNRIKLQILLPNRGIITDRRGLELALNQTNYQLILSFHQKKKQ